MKRLLVLLMIVAFIFVTGCEFWISANFDKDKDDDDEESGAATAKMVIAEPATPDFVENWFYREFGDPAEFPELVGETDQATVLAVAGWVSGFTLEAAGVDHQFRTTGETVDAGGGDSSSLAWLAFHGCRHNGIVNVSVELVTWDDGSQVYVCIWRSSGRVYILDGDGLVRQGTFLAGGGRLSLGLDDIDFWEYE